MHVLQIRGQESKYLADAEPVLGQGLHSYRNCADKFLEIGFMNATRTLEPGDFFGVGPHGPLRNARKSSTIICLEEKQRKNDLQQKNIKTNDPGDISFFFRSFVNPKKNSNSQTTTPTTSSAGLDY